MSRPTVFIVEGHPMMACSVRTCLENLRPQATIHAAGSLRRAEALIAAHGQPLLMVLDLNLPDSEGLSTLAHLKKHAPETWIVVFSGRKDEDIARDAMAMGAHHVFFKTWDHQRFASEIAVLLDARGVREPLSTPVVDIRKIAALTSQRRRVLAEVSSGRSNREIAELLKITESTVRAHVTAILREIGSRNRTEACIAYLRWSANDARAQ